VRAIPGILFEPKKIRINAKISSISEPEMSFKNKSMLKKYTTKLQ
jgi:hypothetical protein